ncbi:MAG TPA: hypothetical protein VMU41_01795 [Candidatus Binataceae bacterium]|nr:hypothetical protein [Candidatus Binataceae bacterium]
MGIRFTNYLRRSLLISAVTAGALFVAALGNNPACAGDVNSDTGNNMSVTGATAGVLPQMSTAGESGILSGLHVSGFLSQTFGMWQNPTALQNYTTSRNNLATSRTWLQVDENYQLNQDNSFFMREWFVYEPPYSFNSANGLGMYGNEFYNQYTVRDAWWQNKWGPLTTYVGNQIVVWGQSLAFRVGDVVNPQDTTWSFGFANLEQSRTPQWMIHPILNLPEFGPTSSNFIEGILIPRYQPMWNSCDYADHRYDGFCNVNAGSVNNGFPAGVAFDPTGRFGAHFASRYQPPSTALSPGTPILGPYFPPGAPHTLQNQLLIGSPLANEFYYCTNAGSATQPANPVPHGLQRPCKFYGGSAAPDTGPTWDVPASTVANWTEGARLHTLVGPAELTAFIYDPFNLYPNTYWQQYTNRFVNKFNPEVLTGVTGDMPIPMPSSLSEYLPFVGRAEAVYGNHQGVNTWDLIGNPQGVRYTDTLNYMVALDVDQAYAPWLTATGNLSANIEFQDFITLDGANSMMEAFGPYTGGALEPESNIKNNVSTLFNVGTSWLWNDIAPTWTMIFSPKGRSFLLFPSVVLNPPWTKAYFLKLQAIEIMGGDLDYSQGGGILKGQSMLIAQFQYNFNLL